MGVLIRDSNGNQVIECWVEKITETKTHRTVVQDLPTANLDYIQSMGTKNRTFTIDGGVSGSGIAQIRQMPGTTGSMLAVDAWGTTMLPLTQFFVNDVSFRDDADAPMMRKFSMSTVEIL